MARPAAGAGSATRAIVRHQPMTADRTTFMIPVFRGKRFENHEVPLDVLPDLAAYRDLVLELARHLFLAGSPSRKRVPKGFVDSFQLVLRIVPARASQDRAGQRLPRARTCSAVSSGRRGTALRSFAGRVRRVS